jgi:hypothetical protein
MRGIHVISSWISEEISSFEISHGMKICIGSLQGGQSIVKSSLIDIYTSCTQDHLKVGLRVPLRPRVSDAIKLFILPSIPLSPNTARDTRILYTSICKHI